MRCNEVVISIALVLRREAQGTEQMSHRGHSPVALRERRTASLRYEEERNKLMKEQKSNKNQQLASLSEGNGYACINTDIELWRKKNDDYFSPTIHVTEFGEIGINVGGHVIVAPIEDWHNAGNKILAVDPKLKNWKRRLAYWLLGW
jgi:hypothetical protein